VALLASETDQSAATSTTQRRRVECVWELETLLFPIPLDFLLLLLIDQLCWFVTHTEAARLPSGHIRSGSAGIGLLHPRSAVVRGRHGAVGHSRSQSPQRVRGQDSRRENTDRRNQVAYVTYVNCRPTL